MKELIPNIHEAKKTIGHYFSAYSRAYIVTNEDLRLSMKYMPENCNMALTVAASGDHPLFCSLYGAKHVDTFDISYNAKCLMDIKTAAMKRLNYLEYLDLLEALYNNEDIIHVHNIDKISNELSIIERCYMRSMRGFALFGRGGWDGKGNSCLPKRQEYQKLRELVKQPYEFYWTDLANVSACLVEKYDFIHLSNIFDYIDDGKIQFTILQRLLEHVNVGGRILIQRLRYGRPTRRLPVNHSFVKKIRKDDITIFERIR